MDWFKAWHIGILRGSLSDADDSTQLIWIKMLAIASESKNRDGRLELAKGRPMSRNYLIEVLHTTSEKYDKAIEQFVNDVDSNGIPRITVESDGTIVLTKWVYYQTNNHKPKKEPMKKQRKDGMVRSLVNQNPEVATDTLKRDFGYTVLDSQGEIK